MQSLFWRIEMICHKCGKVVLWEKMITPDGRIYHIHCWTKFEEFEFLERSVPRKNDTNHKGSEK